MVTQYGLSSTFPVRHFDKFFGNVMIHQCFAWTIVTCFAPKLGWFVRKMTWVCLKHGHGKLTVCYGKSLFYSWVNPLFLWQNRQSQCRWTHLDPAPMLLEILLFSFDVSFLSTKKIEKVQFPLISVGFHGILSFLGGRCITIWCSNPAVVSWNFRQASLG